MMLFECLWFFFDFLFSLVELPFILVEVPFAPAETLFGLLYLFMDVLPCSAPCFFSWASRISRLLGSRSLMG